MAISTNRLCLSSDKPDLWTAPHPAPGGGFAPSAGDDTHRNIGGLPSRLGQACHCWLELALSGNVSVVSCAYLADGEQFEASRRFARLPRLSLDDLVKGTDGVVELVGAIGWLRVGLYRNHQILVGNPDIERPIAKTLAQVEPLRAERPENPIT